MYLLAEKSRVLSRTFGGGGFFHGLIYTFTAGVKLVGFKHLGQCLYKNLETQKHEKSFGGGL